MRPGPGPGLSTPAAQHTLLKSIAFIPVTVYTLLEKRLPYSNCQQKKKASKKKAASNDPQSGADSHCAANAPRSRSRSQYRSQHSSSQAHTVEKHDSHSSDGVHFTGKVTLLFADGDDMHAKLRRELVVDNRPSLHSDELVTFVQEFEADIAIAADCEKLDLENSEDISTGDTYWQVWCNPMLWEISQSETIDLIPDRHAVLTTLRRSTSCGETLRVVAIKTLKGTAQSPLFFSPTERRNVANAIFKLLSKATCPTVVLGNIGFALASCYKHLAEYRSDTEEDMEQKLQIFVTGDQVLMSLFKPITCAPIQVNSLIEADAPKRLMIMCLDTDTPRSSGPHHAEVSQTVEKIPATLTPRIEHFLNLLQAPSHEHLAHVLLFPVVRRQRVCDGVQEVGPVNFSSTLKMLEDAMMLVQRARREAGHDREGTTLSTTEFENALDFLKRIFEESFMENAELKASICDMTERAAELSRPTKKRIRDDRRSAFKAWKRQLMGNVHFLHAVMRHGIFQIRDQQDLATALLQAQSSVDEHHADDVAGAAKLMANKDTLREEAVKARQQVKRARKLRDASNSGTELTQNQKVLCIQLESGELERIRNQKDRAYGHGQSVTNLSLEQAAVMRAFSFKQLEKYFE